MAVSAEKPVSKPRNGPPGEAGPETHDLFDDLKTEVKLEVHEMEGTGQPVNVTQSDQVVRRHVTGLAIGFFIAIAVFLGAAIGAIYLFGHR